MVLNITNVHRKKFLFETDSYLLGPKGKEGSVDNCSLLEYRYFI